MISLSQSNPVSTQDLAHRSEDTPAPVALPTKKWGGKLRWSQEEIELLETLVPNPQVSFKEIHRHLPWRSFNAILSKASRLGLTAKYPEGCL